MANGVRDGAAVARGGVDYEENDPATVLDAWLKTLAGNDDKARRAREGLKPGNYYQACIYAWNAHRDSKTIPTIKADVKKGTLTISH